MLLTGIGLSVDVVGAWVLAVGLFRGPQMVLIYPGGILIRGKADIVRDRAAGAVGGLLLTIGFIGQALGDLGIGPSSDGHMTLICGAMTVAVSWGCAVMLLEFARRVFGNLVESDDDAAQRLDQEREAEEAAQRSTT